MRWDDLRYALGIQRNGTLSAAARKLGVNQTTIARRLERLERDLGVRLFDRGDDRRMIPTEEGEVALAHIAGMEEKAAAVAQDLRKQEEALSGTIRITSVQSFIVGFLAPRVVQFSRMQPDVRLELVSSASNLNLSQREADLAIRFARPVGGGVLTRKIGSVGFSAYASKVLAGRMDEGDFRGLPWAGYDESLAYLPEARWLNETIGAGRQVVAANDVLSLMSMVQNDTAAAVLPCFIADDAPNLTRISGPIPVCRREIWLLTHPNLKRVRRITLFTEWLLDAIRREADFLAGGLVGEGKAAMGGAKEPGGGKRIPRRAARVEY